MLWKGVSSCLFSVEEDFVIIFSRIAELSKRLKVYKFFVNA